MVSRFHLEDETSLAVMFRAWPNYLDSRAPEDFFRDIGMQGHVTAEQYRAFTTNQAIPDPATADAMAELADKQGFISRDDFTALYQQSAGILRQQQEKEAAALQEKQDRPWSESIKVIAPSLKMISFPPEAADSIRAAAEHAVPLTQPELVGVVPPRKKIERIPVTEKRETKTELGGKLEEYRTEHGLNVKQMHEALDMSRKTYLQLLDGNPVLQEMIHSAAELLSIDPKEAETMHPTGHHGRAPTLDHGISMEGRPSTASKKNITPGR